MEHLMLVLLLTLFLIHLNSHNNYPKLNQTVHFTYVCIQIFNYYIIILMLGHEIAVFNID